MKCAFLLLLSLAIAVNGGGSAAGTRVAAPRSLSTFARLRTKKSEVPGRLRLNVFPDELAFSCTSEADDSTDSIRLSSATTQEEESRSPCLLVSRTAALTFEEGATATPLARLSCDADLEELLANKAVATCEVQREGPLNYCNYG